MLTLDFTKRNGNELKYSWRQNSKLFIKATVNLMHASPWLAMISGRFHS